MTWLTEHFYPNLKGYVENDEKKNTIVLRLHVLYPFNVMSLHCKRPSWADSQAKQFVFPFMLLNSCLLQLTVWVAAMPIMFFHSQYTNMNFAYRQEDCKEGSQSEPQKEDRS